MTAHIVYSGDLAGRGHLFEGTTFHVLQRVPTRTYLVEQIKANGGEITLLEKDADVVIADCAKTNQPPGSISWKYIEQSVKKGELLDMADFPASKLAHQKKAGAGVSASPSHPPQPRKIGRTPFTHEDDRELMKFCARKERQGEASKGNIIFYELERLNQRHTFQSWRDRWVKKLQYLPRPTLEDTDEEEQENKDPTPPARSKASKPPKTPRSIPKQSPPAEHASRPSTSKALPGHVRTKPSRAPLRGSSSVPSPSQVVKQVVPYKEVSVGGDKFTVEEKQSLFDVYDEVMDLDEDQIIDAWIAWAEEHPTHTPQEWRNYFNKEVKGKKKTAKPKERVLSPKNSSPPTIPRTHRNENRKRKVTEEGFDHVPFVREVQDSQGSSYQTIQSNESPEDTTKSALTDEETFKRNLLSMAEILLPEQFQRGLDFNPVICDISIPLFEIWQVVMSDEFDGPTEINKQNQWPIVAGKLGFVEPTRERAGRDLKTYCSALLADFELSLESFSEITDEQADEMLRYQLQQTTIEAAQRPRPSNSRGEQVGSVSEEEDDIEDLDAPQSSPLVTLSAKRVNPDNYTPARKRQKVDKGKGREGSTEIPPTPEAVINSRQRSPMKPSPLKNTLPLLDEQLSEEEDSSLFIAPSPFPRRTKPATADPETQDFYFNDPIPAEEDLEEDAEVSLTSARMRQVQGQGPKNTTQSDRRPSVGGSSTQSRNVSTEKNTVDEFIEYQISLGYEVTFVLRALEATSIRVTHDTTHVIESLQQGNGVPRDMPGVWTDRDDSVLREYRKNKKDKNSRANYATLIAKHGKIEIQKRKKFRDDWAS